MTEAIGAQLLAMRKERGLSQEKVARVMEFSISKLQRIETGECGVATVDLKALLAHYGIGEQRTAELIAVAQADRARRRGRQLSGTG